MQAQDFTATLRIRHPSMDPDEITRRLGMPPVHCWRAGDPRSLPAGELGDSAHRETYWVGPASGGLTASYREALRRSPLPAATTPESTEVLLFTPLLRMWRERAFWQRFAAEGGSVDLLVTVEHSDGFRFDLPPKVLTILVELRIGLSLSIESAMHAAA